MTRLSMFVLTLASLSLPAQAVEPKPGGRAAAIEAATANGPVPAVPSPVESPVPSAPALSSPASEAAPVALSPVAAAEAVSPSAEADPAAEEVTLDEKAPQATVPDLTKAASKTLAKAASLMPKDEDSILFDEDLGEVVPVASSSAWLVSAEPLFAELATRSLADDKAARQALTLVIMKGDERGKDAKRQAYDDKLAASLIKLADKGDAKAKSDIEKLAANGNKMARIYLGLEKAPAAAAVPVPQNTTGTATGLAPALTPELRGPTASTAANLSGTSAQASEASPKAKEEAPKTELPAPEMPEAGEPKLP